MAWSDDITEAFAAAISAAKKYTDEETEQMRTKFVKVNALPAQGDSETIYLVPKTEDMFDKKFKDMFGKYCYKTSKDAIISYWGQNPTSNCLFAQQGNDKYVLISSTISVTDTSVSSSNGNWYMQWSDVSGSDPAAIAFGQAYTGGFSIYNQYGVDYEAYTYDQLIDPYNTYDEYIWTSQNTYEKIGDTEIDLSDYATKEEFQALLDKFNNQIGDHTVKTNVPKFNASFKNNTYSVVLPTETQAYSDLADGEIGFRRDECPIPNDLMPSSSDPAVVSKTKVKGWDTIASANTLGKVKVGTGLSINPSTGALSLDQNAIGPEVAEYCSEHFSEWSGALDDTLESNVMAAPANKVGELKSALTELTDTQNNVNLLNENNVTVGYMAANGRTSGSASYRYTEPIPVAEGDVVKAWRKDTNTTASVPMRFITALDSNGDVVSASGSDTLLYSYTVPNGISFIIASIEYIYFGYGLCIVKNYPQPTYIPSYFEPFKKIKESCLPTSYIKDSGRFFVGADTYTEALYLPIVNVTKNVCISFTCNINGSFTSLLVGNGGVNDTYNSYISITGSNINIVINKNSHVYEHGLTISDYIKVVIDVMDNTRANITVLSGGGTYTRTIGWYGFSRGLYRAVYTGASATNCKLDVLLRDANAETFAFGDSYMAIIEAPEKWTHWMADANYDENVLLNGCPGENSNDAIIALHNVLRVGKPKYIFWTLGMNDGADADENNPSSTWLTNIQYMLTLCELYGITPILCTIPTVPTISHQGKNKYIRNSGYRYVDFAKAVGAQSDGTWFTDMLSQDGVHTTQLGAKALWNEVLCDFPEIALKS